MAPADRFRSEYLFLNIIPTGSKPKRSPTPVIVLSAFIAFAAALLFMLGQ